MLLLLGTWRMHVCVFDVKILQVQHLSEIMCACVCVFIKDWKGDRGVEGASTAGNVGYCSTSSLHAFTYVHQGRTARIRNRCV